MRASEKIIELLSDKHCGVLPPASIFPENTIEEIGFDSLRFMEFVVLIEEEFNIDFPDELLDIQSTTRVGDIVERIEREV